MIVKEDGCLHEGEATGQLDLNFGFGCVRLDLEGLGVYAHSDSSVSSVEQGVGCWSSNVPPA